MEFDRREALEPIRELMQELLEDEDLPVEAREMLMDGIVDTMSPVRILREGESLEWRSADEVRR